MFKKLLVKIYSSTVCEITCTIWKNPQVVYHPNLLKLWLPGPDQLDPKRGSKFKLDMYRKYV